MKIEFDNRPDFNPFEVLTTDKYHDNPAKIRRSAEKAINNPHNDFAIGMWMSDTGRLYNGRAWEYGDNAHTYLYFRYNNHEKTSLMVEKSCQLF